MIIDRTNQFGSRVVLFYLIRKGSTEKEVDPYVSLKVIHAHGTTVVLVAPGE